MPSPFAAPDVNPFAQQNQNAQVQYPGNPSPVASQQVPGAQSGQVQHNPDPSNPNDTRSSDTNDKSLVDLMGEVWDNEPKDDDKISTLDEEHVKTLTSRYVPNIDKEALAEALQSGDAEKLHEIMSGVARDAYSAATATNSAISSNYLDQERSKFKQRVSSELTQTNVMSTLSELNPNISKSAPIKDMASSLAKKYMAKFPNSTPQEAAEKINTYLKSTFGGSDAKKDADDKQSQQSEEMDWTNF